MRILLSLFLLIGQASSAAWVANLDTEAGQLDLLASIAGRHPALLTNLSQYGQDGIAILRDAAPLLGDLRPGDRVRALGVGAGVSSSLEGTLDGGARRLDENAVEKWKGDLERRLRATIDRGRRFTTLGDDLLHREFASRAERVDFLASAPLLYDGAGRAGDESVDAIELARGMDLSELEIRVTDTWTEHLRPVVEAVGSTAWAEALRSLQNTYVEKVLAPALTRARVDSSPEAFGVDLEEVPKVVALLRGPIGFDCSSATVPYYALLPGTRVFWIHRGRTVRREPVGYVLMTEIEFEGRVVPYLLTVNGASLRAAEARAAALQIARLYDQRELLVANAENIVNSVTLRAGLWAEDPRAETIASVNLPIDWNLVDSLSRDSYYAASRLKRARRIRLNPVELDLVDAVKMLPRREFYPARSFANLSRLDRAVVAGSLKGSSAAVPAADVELTARTLGSSKTTRFGLDADQVRALVTHFEETPRKVLRFLSSPARLQTLGRLWASRAFDLIARSELHQRLVEAQARHLGQREEVWASQSAMAKSEFVRVLLELPDVEGTFDYRRRRYTRDLVDPDLLPTLGYVPKWTRVQSRHANQLIRQLSDQSFSRGAISILSKREVLTNGQLRRLARVVASGEIPGGEASEAAELIGRKVAFDRAGLKLLARVGDPYSFPFRGLAKGLLHRDDLTPEVWDLLERRFATMDNILEFPGRLAERSRGYDREREAHLIEIVAERLASASDYRAGDFLKVLQSLFDFRPSRELHAVIPRAARMFVDQEYQGARSSAYRLLKSVGDLTEADLVRAAGDKDSGVRGFALTTWLERATDGRMPTVSEEIDALSVDSSHAIQRALIAHLAGVPEVRALERHLIERMFSTPHGRSSLVTILDRRSSLDGWPTGVLAGLREHLLDQTDVRVHRRLEHESCAEGLSDPKSGDEAARGGA